MVKKILGSLLICSLLFGFAFTAFGQVPEWGEVQELKMTDTDDDSVYTLTYDESSDTYTGSDVYFIEYDSGQDIYRIGTDSATGYTNTDGLTGLYGDRFLVELVLPPLSDRAGSIMSSTMDSVGSVIFSVLAPILGLAGVLIALFFGFKQLRRWVGGSRS